MTDKAHRWRQIEQICEAALARSPVEREAFLRHACGDDASLRRHADAVLAQADRAERFLEQPVAVVSASLLELAPDPGLSGAKVGTLTIGSLIGSGGMGHVYRARDTELDRDVAVKVLRPEHAGDADTLARFAREARLLASLNHRNIAQIHGVVSLPAGTAIVMELIEGETLERLARGACDLGEALHVGGQIAAALEAAHGHDVIHRDLKPANIRIGRDGSVKVVDFGLAKSLAHDPRPDGRAGGTGSTIPGLIIGTAAYMAPEQVRAKPVDRRVDLWALGCVLFELLTGRPAFGGETPSDIMAGIIDHAPDWQALPEATPPALRRMLRRCLEKEPARRLDSAAVARLELDEAEAELTAMVPGHVSGPRARQRWRSWTWTATGAAGGVGAALLLMPADRSSMLPLTATTVTVRDLNLSAPGVHFAVAPDGRRVVFSGRHDGGRSMLLRRDLERIDPVPIAGTAGGSDVFFAPDGQSIGFETASELWTAPLEGGAPRRLMRNLPLRGGDWAADAHIVVGRVGSGLWITPAAGGESRQLTVPEAGVRHEMPQLLPGGRSVLFTIFSIKAPPRVAVLSLESGDIRELLEGSGARFVGPAHLLFGRQGQLWAVAFDPGSLETTGSASAVLDDVLSSPAGYPQFSISGGLLAYVRSSKASPHLGKATLAVADRRGETSALPLPADNYLLPRWSPAGDRLVVQVGATRDLWTYDVRRETFTRLTFDRVVAFSAPTWTPDGRRVVFTTWFGNDVGLASVPADGSGPVEPLAHLIGMRSFERTHPALMPDGSAAILTGLAPGAVVEDLLIVGLMKEPRLETLLRDNGVERNVAVDATGRFIAYNSDESGRHEVYVRPLSDVGGRRWQISADGGAFPVWTRGGQELIYTDDQGRFTATAVKAHDNGELGVEKPLSLFARGCGVGPGLDRCFDVTSDGERFLLLLEQPQASDQATVELVLLQNWVAELVRLVPP